MAINVTIDDGSISLLALGMFAREHGCRLRYADGRIHVIKAAVDVVSRTSQTSGASEHIAAMPAEVNNGMSI